MIGYSVLFRNLRKQGHELHVSCAFPEIFQGNPNLTSLDGFNYETWYEQVAMKCDKIIRKDFYRENSVAKMNKHFTEVMCEMYGVDHDSVYPDYFITKKEDEEAKSILSNFKKPTILMQTYANTNPKDGSFQNCNKNWPINYVNGFTKIAYKKYDILHICMPNEFAADHSWPIKGLSMRQIIALLKNVDTFVGIDSFLNHASAIFKKEGVVLFGKTPQVVFSYPHNKYIQKDLCKKQPCGRPDGSLFDFVAVKDKKGEHTNWVCPDFRCMNISGAEVLASIKV